MSSYRKPEFGFTPEQTYNLHRRYTYLRNHTWESFSAFLQWASETNVAKGAFLRKKDESLPHGPDNSYWSTTPAAVARVYEPTKIYVSPFCEGCPKMGEMGCGGCEKWEEYFVGNWNKNIHVDLSHYLPRIKEAYPRETFKYEHPDDIRRERGKKR